jgi:RHS repeat-associated protein
LMTQTNVSELRIPLPGGATYAGVDFLHKDWLGSARLVSGRASRSSVADRAFAPFGEVYNNIGNTSNMNFTGDYPDLISGYGTFDTPNRELNATQGRWISPDPSHSSWNAYSYTTNPLLMIDPSGLFGAVYAPLCNCGGWDLSTMVSSDDGASSLGDFAPEDTWLGWTGTSFPPTGASLNGTSNASVSGGSNAIVWSEVTGDLNGSYGTLSCCFGSSGAGGVASAQASVVADYDPNEPLYTPRGVVYGNPRDPSNPGHALIDNSIVQRASGQAFMTTQNGTARSGLAEAGFAIEYSDGTIWIAYRVDSVNGDGKPNQLHIKTDANTIAIMHVHGNKADPIPSPGDRDPDAQVPDFVRSQYAVYVTIPGVSTQSPPLNNYVQLQ